MATVLLVVHLMIAAALCGVVLLQRSEGGALGIGGGGGGFMTGRGTANLLTRITGVLAGLFFLTSIGLTLLALHGSSTISPLDAGAPKSSASASGPAVPGGGAPPAGDAAKEPPRGGVLDSLEKGRQQLPQVPKSQ
jgi:preprotein translocase subunit SecG